jgi:hypothetical protein
MTNLENELYNIANEIVGNVGPSTIVATAITGEKYIVFYLMTKDKNEICSVFRKWIESYVDFKKLAKPEGDFFDRNPKLTIFWRRKPKIKKDDDGVFLVYARLLISMLNFEIEASNDNS